MVHGGRRAARESGAVKPIAGEKTFNNAAEAAIARVLAAEREGREAVDPARLESAASPRAPASPTVLLAARATGTAAAPARLSSRQQPSFTSRCARSTSSGCAPNCRGASRLRAGRWPEMLRPRPARWFEILAARDDDASARGAGAYRCRTGSKSLSRKTRSGCAVPLAKVSRPKRQARLDSGSRHLPDEVKKPRP
jgi:hypothetical protein